MISDCDAAILATAGHVAGPIILATSLLFSLSRGSAGAGQPEADISADAEESAGGRSFCSSELILKHLRILLLMLAVASDVANTFLVFVPDLEDDKQALVGSAVSGLAALSGVCCLVTLCWISNQGSWLLFSVFRWSVVELLCTAPILLDRVVGNVNARAPTLLPIISVACRAILALSCCVQRDLWCGRRSFNEQAEEEARKVFAQPTVSDADNADHSTRSVTKNESLRNVGKITSSVRDISNICLHEESGVLAQILMTWMERLFTSARVRPLMFQDLSAPPSEAEPSAVQEQLALMWRETSPHHSFLRRVLGKVGYLLGSLVSYSGVLLLAMKLLGLLLNFAVIIFLQRFLFSMESESPERRKNCIVMASALLVCTLLSFVLKAQEQYFSGIEELKIISALRVIVHRVCLHARSDDEAEVPSTVRMIAQQIPAVASGFSALLEIVCIPVAIVSSCILVNIFFHDFAVLAMMALLFLFMVSLVVARFHTATLGESADERRQDRECAARELVSGCITLKQLCWERRFADRVLGLQRRELRSQAWIKLRRFLGDHIYTCLGPLLFFTASLAYTLTGGEQARRPDLVIACLACTYLLARYANRLPSAVTRIRTAATSLSQIEQFINRSSTKNPFSSLEDEGRDNSYKPPSVPESSTEFGELSFGDQQEAISQPNLIIIQMELATIGWRAGRHQQQSFRDSTRSSGAPMHEDWNPDEDRPECSFFDVLSDVSLGIKYGSRTAVVGPEGKSTLLMSLIEESHISRGNITVRGTTSFCPQSYWVERNWTIEENILLGAQLDSGRFEKCVTACGLLDLVVDKGGEGHTLLPCDSPFSVLQRISLARAIYRKADIYILDEPLSGLPQAQRRDVLSRLFRSLLRKATVIFAINDFELARMADDVLLLRQGGVGAYGRTADVLSSLDQLLPTEVSMAEPVNTSEIRDNPASQSRRVPLYELTASGIGHSERPVEDLHSTWQQTQIIGAYVKAAGTFPVCCVILLFGLGQICLKGGEFAVAEWASAYNVTNPISLSRREENTMPESGGQRWPWISSWVGCATGDIGLFRDFILRMMGVHPLIVFSGTVLAWLLAGVLASIISVCGQSAASRFLYRSAVDRVAAILPSLICLDKYRKYILWSLSHTSDSADFRLPRSYQQLLTCCLNIFVCTGTMLFLVPELSFCIPVMALAYSWLRGRYMRARRGLHKLLAESFESVDQRTCEVLSGCLHIRSVFAAAEFDDRFKVSLRRNLSAMFTVMCARTWAGIRVGFLLVAVEALIFTTIVLRMEYSHLQNWPSFIGLCLVNGLIVFWELDDLLDILPASSDSSQALAPLLEVGHVPVEDPAGGLGPLLGLGEEIAAATKKNQGAWRKFWTGGQVQKPAWVTPADQLIDGNLHFEHVNVVCTPPSGDSYSTGLNFAVEMGRWIGFSGLNVNCSPNLVHVLSGITELDRGRILLCNKDISTLQLKDLRTYVAVVPRDPFLFSGTVRENLDLTGGATGDWQIWAALEQCHAGEIVRDFGDRLDSHISAGGGDLTPSTRRLLVLARAVLAAEIKGARVLCLEDYIGSFDERSRDLILARHLGGGMVVIVTSEETLDPEIFDTVIEFGREENTDDLLKLAQEGNPLDQLSDSEIEQGWGEILLDIPSSIGSSAMGAVGTTVEAVGTTVGAVSSGVGSTGKGILKGFKKSMKSVGKAAGSLIKKGNGKSKGSEGSADTTPLTKGSESMPVPGAAEMASTSEEESAGANSPMAPHNRSSSLRAAASRAYASASSAESRSPSPKPNPMARGGGLLSSSPAPTSLIGAAGGSPARPTRPPPSISAGSPARPNRPPPPPPKG